jgi:hypothetical protein
MTTVDRRGRPLERPDERGRFGEYGGRFAPETLMPALDELERAFVEAWADPVFVESYRSLLTDFVGRPTPLHLAPRLSERLGVTVLLKREDLAHTGAHKINNAIGQACSPAGWASRGSSPRPEPASTAWPPPPPPPPRPGVRRLHG